MIPFATVFGLAVLLLIGAAVSHIGGLDARSMLDLFMILAGLVGLGGVLKLPWDLYFEARGLVLDQQESAKRGVTIDGDEATYAAASTRRLLLLCLACHAFAAALSAGTSWASGGQIGYAFAGFFLVSTVFRPMGSFYAHMRARLLELRQRARYPREDILAMRSRVQETENRLHMLEVTLAQAQAEAHHHRTEADRVLRRLEQRQEGAEDKLVRQGQGFDAKVDRVCREFEGAVARLTSEKEILEGMRAFVRLVKEA